jgi:hypothetical protein
VADSQIPLLDANLENFDGLRKNLLEHNVDLNFIPLVFQYNKRDLDNLIPVETFNSLLNPLKLPYLESSAVNGMGVFETLKEISKLTVPYVREKVFGEKAEPALEEVVEPEKIVEVPKPEEARMDVKAPPEEKEKPVRLTKIKFKSQTDIEKEMEKLAEEFSHK